MNSKKITGIKTGEISQLAKRIVDENIRRTTDNMDALSPEVARRMLNELQVHHLELEVQNVELRQAQNDLEASRSLYFNFYNLAPVGYLTISEKGLIVEANLTLATWLGITNNQLLGQPLTQFICREDQDQYYLCNKQLFSTGKAKACELRMVNKSGGEFWIRMETTVAFGAEDTAHCYAVISDITERKLTEEALTTSEVQLRTLVETIPDLIWLKKPEGIYLSCNKMFENFFGAKKADIVGKTDYDFVDKQRADSFRENDLKAMAAGKPSVNEELLTFANDGHKALVETIKTPMYDSSGTIIGVLGIARDITERKRIEEEMKSARERYGTLMEQSYEALALVDIETQEVVEINHRFTEMFGYSLPEDSPLFANQVVVDSQSNLDTLFNITLKQQRVIPPVLRVAHCRNGSDIYVERAATVIRIGNKEYLLVSNRDITAERLRQLELTRDVEFASRVQRELLTEISDSPFVTIRTLYHPSNLVSGDAYLMNWHKEGTVLRGFLIDVTGHGVATALQTATINALLREIANVNLPLKERLHRVSSRAAKYFSKGSYAAMVGFELDFNDMELRYVSAGITQFYTNGIKKLTPGMFVGMLDNAEIDSGAIPMVEGDTFYFLTDGFTDKLSQTENENFWSPNGKEFDADVAALEQLAENGDLKDDATGLCFRINGGKRSNESAIALSTAVTGTE